MAERRGLVFVSSGLEADGGGRAALGRLLADSAARYASARGLAYEILSLGAIAPFTVAAPRHELGGSRLALARALWRHQSAAKPPVLLFDLLGPARIESLIPPSRRSPYAVMLLGVEVWQPLSWSRRRALSGAELLLPISRFTLERAAPFLPPVRGATAILHPVLEDRPPAGERDEALLRELDEGFVLTVGRMSAAERYKGHDELLDAWPRVLAERPAARLVIAGDGDDRDRLNRRAEALGLGGKVRFTGFVSEATLAELYRRAAVLSMVSRGEGFGLVYLEAMRAAKPCVAARGTAAAEIVVDGETGRLVEMGDVAALAGALLDLLGSPAERARLGEAGERRYGERFSLPRFDGELWDHLDRLTAPAPG